MERTKCDSSFASESEDELTTFENIVKIEVTPPFNSPASHPPYPARRISAFQESSLSGGSIFLSGGLSSSFNYAVATAVYDHHEIEMLRGPILNFSEQTYREVGKCLQLLEESLGTNSPAGNLCTYLTEQIDNTVTAINKVEPPSIPMKSFVKKWNDFKIEIQSLSGITSPRRVFVLFTELGSVSREWTLVTEAMKKKRLNFCTRQVANASLPLTVFMVMTLAAIEAQEMSLYAIMCALLCVGAIIVLPFRKKPTGVAEVVSFTLACVPMVLSVIPFDASPRNVVPSYLVTSMVGITTAILYSRITYLYCSIFAVGLMLRLILNGVYTAGSASSALLWFEVLMGLTMLGILEVGHRWQVVNDAHLSMMTTDVHICKSRVYAHLFLSGSIPFRRPSFASRRSSRILSPQRRESIDTDLSSKSSSRFSTLDHSSPNDPPSSNAITDATSTHSHVVTGTAFVVLRVAGRKERWAFNLGSLCNDIGMCIVEVNSVICHWNSAMESYTNIPFHDVLGGNLLSLIPDGTQQDTVQHAIRDVLSGAYIETGKGISADIAGHDLRELIHMKFLFFPVRNNKGETCAVLMVGSMKKDHRRAMMVARIQDVLRLGDDHIPMHVALSLLRSVASGDTEADDISIENSENDEGFVSVPAALGAAVSFVNTDARVRRVVINVDVDTSSPFLVNVDTETFSHVLRYCLSTLVTAVQGCTVDITAQAKSVDATTAGKSMLYVHMKCTNMSALPASSIVYLQKMCADSKANLTTSESGMVIAFCVKMLYNDHHLDTSNTGSNPTTITCAAPEMKLALFVSTVNSIQMIGTLWQQGHIVKRLRSISQVQTMSEDHNVEVVILDDTISPELITFAMCKSLKEKGCVVVMIMDSKDDVRMAQFQQPEYDVQVLCSPIRHRDIQTMITKVSQLVFAHRQDTEYVERARRLLAETKQCPWECGPLLGSGGYGNVYEATNVLTGGKMAVKKITVPVDEAEQKNMVDKLLGEIEVMLHLEHPNTVHYFYCERSDANVCLFMELVKGGSVADKVKKNGPMTTQETSRILRDVLQGLDYLHNNRIVHRDIKGANVLLTKHGVGKLADFGTAVTVKPSELIDTTHGTYCFMAPEVLNAEKYGWQCDIWSVGCLVMEMLTGKVPFKHVGGPFDYVARLNYGDIPDITPIKDPLARSFVEWCLSVDPRMRPTCRNLLVHPFVTQQQNTLMVPTPGQNKAALLLRSCDQSASFSGSSLAGTRRRSLWSQASGGSM